MLAAVVAVMTLLGCQYFTRVITKAF